MSEVDDERFLILAPTGRDAELTRALLERAQLRGVVCASLRQAVLEIERGAAALLIAEEVLVPAAARLLVETLARQPPWSDLPILMFTGREATIQTRHPTVEQLAPLGNVTLLDRPLRPITMVAAARSALRARRRQYQTRQELQQRELAVRQRDQFLAMLGHELRNPLSAILLAVEMSERGGDPGRHLATIRRQSRNLTRMVDDLLDVSRITTGKVVIQKQPVELDELLARCVQAVEPAARAQQLAVALRGAERRLIVDGDPVRLEQVFSNLITNAIKYTPSGGCIEVTLAREGDEATVRVRDDGIGLSPEVLPSVFELFFQVERSLARSQGGLGIGLTLVRNLVALHGGRVAAASAGLGRGSEFSVTLPLAARLPAPADDAAPGDADATPAARILLVEDNDDTRELLHTLVATFGHEVESVPDGTAALERALATRPDVLVVDIGLPGMDGYEVARRVREALGPDVVIVALTGYGQPEDERRAFAAGFNLHFTKPVDPSRLQRVLRRGRVCCPTTTAEG